MRYSNEAHALMKVHALTWAHALTSAFRTGSAHTHASGLEAREARASAPALNLPILEA